MFTPMTYRPCGLLDATVEPVEVKDPEAALYEGDKPWILVKTGQDLKAYMSWESQGIHVAVICVEATLENPLDIDWRYAAPHVLYVDLPSVSHIPSGVVPPTMRFTLRDLEASRNRQPKA